MECDLSTPVNLNNRNVAGCEQVFPGGVQAERKDWRVLAEPDFVSRSLVARIGEVPHFVPQGHVFLPAAKACLHSAIRTSS